MLSETDGEDHYNPSVRLIEIEKNGSHCGFQLTRGKWDPYPWVSSVDMGTAASLAGVKPGDCLLEVNGEDIIGQRISEIAEIVKSKPGQVSLLLWNAGVDPQCTPEALCCGPLPKNLQRLSACMSTILIFLECPVCLDTIIPPTYQCDNGHLICIRCRSKSERCPVCRLRLNRGRSLLADQVYSALIDAFNLREESEETKIIKIQQIFKRKKKKGNVPDIKVTQSHTNKFLSKIIPKFSSVDNLTSDMKFLSPNITPSESDFANTQLKTKSLSTNEIFIANSPVGSRSGSISKLSRKEKKYINTLNVSDDSRSKRPASYHGSYESLERENYVTVSPVHKSLSSLKIDVSLEDGILFHCPFSNQCASLIKANEIFEHFNLNHCESGPLVQYFNSNINVCLKNLEEKDDICYMIYKEGNIFFLKIVWSGKEDNETLQSILIWAWYLGTKKSAREYGIQVEIKDLKDVLLSVQNSVFSLSSTPLQEIIDFKKGVYLSAKMLDTLEYSSKKLTMDIKIFKTDN